MRTPVSVLLLLGLVLSCTVKTASPPARPKRDGSLLIALSAAHKSMDLRGGSDEESAVARLASAIADDTGHTLVILESGTSSTSDAATTAAALRHADILINLQHPGGRPGNFVTVTATSVTTGYVLGDTALSSLEKPDARVAQLTGWFETLLNSLTSPEKFEAVRFADRLKNEKKCVEALEFIGGYGRATEEESQKLEAVRSACETDLLSTSTNTSTIQYRLRLRFEGVSNRAQQRFSTTAQSSQLDPEIIRISRQVADLLIGCANDCKVGRMRLTISYVPNIYRAIRGTQKDELVPYRRLASAFLQFRQLSTGLGDTAFPLEIVVQDQKGAEAKILVGGSPDKPSLTLTPESSSFF